jgi:hypothetical protein
MAPFCAECLQILDGILIAKKWQRSIEAKEVKQQFCSSGMKELHGHGKTSGSFVPILGSTTATALGSAINSSPKD